VGVVFKRQLLQQSSPIHFDGNGYSDEWKAEAARRGLDCETNPVLMFDAYLRPSSVEMFTKTGVMTPVELEARNEVKWEMYTKKIQIEARVLGDLAINHILPVATRYMSILLDNMVKIRNLFPGKKGEELSSMDADTVETIMEHSRVIKTEVARMVEARKEANRITNEREKALAYSLNVAPCLEVIRHHIDKLELMVDNEMWPLPKYRELLFIR
ncbi:MAG: glutamine synthetase type III, partial [Duncaniella sp.]|nr:glutamine synthetase type III [Duncaniella sp.]